MNILILLFCVLCFTFMLRGTYRLLVPSGLAPSGDAAIHLIIADGIRRNGHRIPDRFPEFLLSGPHNYPSCFHWLLSFIPRKTLEKFEPFIGTLIELVHNIFVFTACYYLALRQGVTNAIWVGFLATIIFALTPLFVDHVGRVFLLSERPFGSLLGTIFVFFGLQYIVSPNLWLLVGAAVVIGIIFISSKFTVQAILFISFIFSLLSWTVKLWLPIAAGFLLISLASRGYALRVLAGHLRHSIFYKKFLLQNYLRPTSQYRDLFQSLIRAIRHPYILIKAFRTNSLLKLFSMMPWVIVLFPLAIKNSKSLESNSLLQVCLLWIVSCGAVLCITSFNGMRFLGEPERYLEISILPVSFLISFFLMQTRFLGIWVLFFLVALYALMAFVVIFSGARRGNLWSVDQERLCQWLLKAKPSRVMTIPLKMVSFLVYRTNHKGLNILTNISEKSQQRKFRELCPILYPYPDSDLKKLINEYELDLIVVHKPTLAFLEMNNPDIHYDFSDLKKEYENGSYVAYSV